MVMMICLKNSENFAHLMTSLAMVACCIGAMEAWLCFLQRCTGCFVLFAICHVGGQLSFTANWPIATVLCAATCTVCVVKVLLEYHFALGHGGKAMQWVHCALALFATDEPKLCWWACSHGVGFPPWCCCLN